ncbi:MAG TPA: hypothetical protein DDW52_00330 [Planctomycetaceae bacterium]|nr:hypothetical protein [Planctomycetaceae bacterium]
MNLSRLIFGVLISICICSLPAYGQAEDFNADFPEDVNFGEEFGEDWEEDFATSGPSEEAIAAAITAYFGFLVCVGVVSLAVQIFIAYLLYDALNTVPEEFRQIEPWLPWLVFIPLVGIVIAFIAFIKTPKSLALALNARGDTSHGDCGESNGLWGMILSILGCTGPIGWVLLIMSLLKINKAKQALRAS